MATLTNESILKGEGGSGLLPRSVSNEIWKAATAQSVVPSLAKSHPVILGENIIPVLTKRPSASIVGEGQDKADSQLEVGAKSIKPIKAVVGLEFTMETLHSNPANVLDLMSGELSDALARQIDLAIFHGRQASDGKNLSGSPEFINQTEKRVKLSGLPEKADAELWDGYNILVDADKPHDFTGFAMDPRHVGLIANARDKEGRRLNPEIPMGGSVTSYAGMPVAVSRSVSGQMDASADTKVRAFGGDWNSLRFGRALDISLKKIEYGDPFGNGDLQRRNAVAFLTEVIFGWAILDKNAFVAYELSTDEAP
ncbi:phage major capsid protein [Corynebacterium ulceribovis]|uniref:phage major capsid protein n=1 Tax=Corynebacterium ulceribovis TaxID=487732 RepID=UPI00035FAC33|nr:phage major capsid protein [Corynebacterium ulceribovis]